ncbi:hypothetical protein LguiB_019132 [Lonicera macranthoides]
MGREFRERVREKRKIVKAEEDDVVYKPGAKMEIHREGDYAFGFANDLSNGFGGFREDGIGRTSGGGKRKSTLWASNPWNLISLDHPATFETLAMDSEAKEMVMDLERFVKREYYRKVGKAWKRGYLLNGPPGTGKSSLIAAMANYLNFDIYYLELTDIRRNSELRRLLVGMANRSILVVEDINSTIGLEDRLAPPPPSQLQGFHQDENKVTLSGFLNFIDGLWSSCGDDRIIVFTTNHKEKLDPALLRPGRMDLHIHMSYCTSCGFKLLAANYLDIKAHKLFGEIEELIRTTEVTPAEVAEQLLKSDDPDVTLIGLIGFLHEKEKEIENAMAKKVQVEESAENEKEREREDTSEKEGKTIVS